MPKSKNEDVTDKNSLLSEIPKSWVADAKKLFERTAQEWTSFFREQAMFDKYELDTAVAEQAQFFINCAGLSSVASKLRDFVETWLKQEESEVDLAVRSNPLEFDLEPDSKGKLMESAIKSKVALDNRVCDIGILFMEMKEYAKVMNKAIDGFDQRKTMLRLEGDLWLGEYYSSADIREKLEDDVREKAAKKASERKAKRRS